MYCRYLNKFDPIKGIETMVSFAVYPTTFVVFKQIWPDQGDWNDSTSLNLSSLQDLNKFDPIKGIETRWLDGILIPTIQFKQIWPDQGDWNILAYVL